MESSRHGANGALNWTSEWQLEEFRRVSHYPKLRKYLQPIEAGNLVNGLRHQAQLLDELPDVELSADPDDKLPVISGTGCIIAPPPIPPLWGRARARQPLIIQTTAITSR